MTSAAIKILCVDDEADIRQDVAEELRDAGYEVIEAFDGLDGFEAIVREEPDLVVSDLTMPRLDGHGLLRKLRDECPDLADLPIIFLSALSDREHILEGKRLGADDYLTKPIDFDLLLVTVEARVNQILRMKTHKEAQMVKLYQSLNARAATDSVSKAQVNSGKVEDKAVPAQADEEVKGPSDLSLKTPVSGGTAQPGNRGQLDSLAKNSGGTIVAGRFQMLGLETIKEALGDDWPKHAARVTKIASDTITKRLADHDVFEITRDKEFLVCFGSLSEQEAAFKAETIAREIQAQILGSDSLDPRVTEGFNIVSDVHEVALSEKEAADSDNVVDLLTARLKQAVEIARESEQEVMDWILNNSKIVQIRINAPQGKGAPVAIAEFDDSTRTEIISLQRARPSSEALIADLDIIKLGRTLELLSENSLESQPVLLVNVNFSTIRSQALLERYLKICASLTDSARNRLALNIVGIPAGYPPARTQSLVHALRRNCRLVTLELSGLSLGNIEPNTLQVSIVACDYQSIGPKFEKQAGAVKRLLTSLREQKVRSLVYGVPRQKDIEQLFQQGVSFVAHR